MTAPLLPFHQWKQNEVNRMGGWFKAAKPKEYYWKAYGDYCNKLRHKADELRAAKEVESPEDEIERARRMV